MLHVLRIAFVLAMLVASSLARGDDTAPTPPHGPDAPDNQFPSHVFRLEARAPPRVQLGFNYGLSQPILLHGFNAAVEVRYRRLVLTYSHGQGLDDTPFESAAERNAGATLAMPWSTGGGIGVLLIDELWVLADFKVHHFEVETAVDHPSYTTVTVGGEIGWRFFVWRGFNVALVGRYWSWGGDSRRERQAVRRSSRPAGFLRSLGERARRVGLQSLTSISAIGFVSALL
jgi:hypothetical protein